MLLVQVGGVKLAAQQSQTEVFSPRVLTVNNRRLEEDVLPTLTPVLL